VSLELSNLCGPAPARLKTINHPPRNAAHLDDGLSSDARASKKHGSGTALDTAPLFQQKQQNQQQHHKEHE
jgi:hypothetical protein